MHLNANAHLDTLAMLAEVKTVLEFQGFLYGNHQNYLHGQKDISIDDTIS